MFCRVYFLLFRRMALEVNIAWDLDNCLPEWPMGHPNYGDVNAIIQNLIDFVRLCFPTARTIRIKGWSNFDPQFVTLQMRQQLSQLAVDVVDTPLGPNAAGLNAADRVMMREKKKKKKKSYDERNL